MKEPQISIILPVYNAEQYISDAVASMVNQSFKNFELIIIDDGSTDNSFQFLKVFKAKDRRIRLYSRPNRGLVSTLNEGIAYSKGQYIARMDADDISHKNRLQVQYEYMTKNPSCVAAGTGATLIDPDGQALRDFPVLTSHNEIDDFHLSLKGGSAIIHPTVMIRKESLLKIKGYQEKFLHAQDIDLFLRLAEIGTLANIDMTLLQYRLHHQSIGHHGWEMQRRCILMAVIDAYKRRKLNASGIDEQTPPPAPSITDVHRKWAWWALQGNNLDTARKHALTALRLAPFSVKNIKLLCCVLRGY